VTIPFGGECLFALGVGDEVCGAKLVVWTPPAPILHLIKELIEFFGIAREAGRRGTRRHERLVRRAAARVPTASDLLDAELMPV
jgi:hypothetical protein